MLYMPCLRSPRVCFQLIPFVCLFFSLEKGIKKQGLGAKCACSHYDVVAYGLSNHQRKEIHVPLPTRA
jgi:hypothetical protein